MAAWRLKLLSLTLLLLTLGRFVYNISSFWICAVCAYKGKVVESCTSSFTPQQQLINNIAGTATMLEAVNSCVLIILIFFWERFHPMTFFYGMLLVGHFWIWFALVFAHISTLFVTDADRKGGKNSYLGYLVAATVCEDVLSTLLAAALNFINRKTIHFWIETGELQGELGWRKFLKILYDFLLLSSAFRHFGLFLYVTALVAQSVGLERTNRGKDFTSFLLVLDVAMRGSFAQFFFAKFFQGRDLPNVCAEYAEAQPSEERLIISTQQEETFGKNDKEISNTFDDDSEDVENFINIDNKKTTLINRGGLETTRPHHSGDS